MEAPTNQVNSCCHSSALKLISFWVARNWVSDFVGLQLSSQAEDFPRTGDAQPSYRRAASSACTMGALRTFFFTGFGITRDYDKASTYLIEAALSGVVGAQAFFARLMYAMHRDPHEALQAWGSLTRQEADEKLGEFLIKGIENGYAEILSDLKDLDDAGARYASAQETICARRVAVAAIEEDERIMLSDIFDEEEVPQACSQIATDITNAAGAGDLGLVQTILAETPLAVNEQDVAGNTAIIRAAKASRFDVAKALIQCNGFTTKISNYRQQNVLHFLPNFSDEEAVSILPALFQSGADFDQECCYIERGWGNAPDLTPHFRGCPLLQTVLCDRLALFHALLEQIHRVQGGRSNCRLCESGSRFRKIVATAIMMRRASMVEAIQEHRKAHGASDTTDIRRIEVWYNHELKPVWQLAMNGPAALVGLPESFARAVMYGRFADDVLRKTLALIWQDDTEYVKQNAYTQLSHAVMANSSKAVEEVLDEARRRGLQNDWWCTTARDQMVSVCDSPLMLSIRLGFRDIFDILWPVGKAFICDERQERCSMYKCIDCRRPFGYSNLGGHCAFWLVRNPKTLKP